MAIQVNGECLEELQAWQWDEYLITYAGGGSHHVARVQCWSGSYPTEFELTYVGEWLSLHDAVQGARHDRDRRVEAMVG